MKLERSNCALANGVAKSFYASMARRLLKNKLALAKEAC